jgi:hypothetical protein
MSGYIGDISGVSGSMHGSGDSTLREGVGVTPLQEQLKQKPVQSFDNVRYVR